MRVVLCFLLALIAAPAWAEWVKVGTGDNNTLYADTEKRRTEGGMVRMWSLHDFNAARVDTRGKSFMSAIMEDEFDCKNKMTRTVYFSFYSEKLAQGKAVYVDPTPDKWSPISSNLATQVLGKFACGD